MKERAGGYIHICTYKKKVSKGKREVIRVTFSVVKHTTRKKRTEV